MLPLVKHLTPQERARLTVLIGALSDDDAASYRAIAVKNDEFSSDTDPVAWDAGGWEGPA